MKTTKIIYNPETYKPTLRERLDEIFPWWVPRIRINIYMDPWTIAGFLFLGLLVAMALRVVIF